MTGSWPGSNYATGGLHPGDRYPGSPDWYPGSLGRSSTRSKTPMSSPRLGGCFGGSAPEAEPRRRGKEEVITSPSPLSVCHRPRKSTEKSLRVRERHSTQVRRVPTNPSESPVVGKGFVSSCHGVVAGMCGLQVCGFGSSVVDDGANKKVCASAIQ